MTLFLGDSFEIFKEYQISEKDVFEAYSTPERFESMENNVRLYLKSFNNSDCKKKLLLLGTQRDNDKENMAFSYWIPSDYGLLKGSILEILEIFTNQFGLKIKIGEKEGYFIKYAERLVSGKLIDPNAIIKILAPDQIPCEYFIFTSENLVGSLNKVSIFYAFAINKGKYHFWLYSYPTVKIEIKAGWYDFVKSNLLEYVQPNGQTSLKIHKQKFTDKLEPDLSNNLTTIDVPEIYKHQFSHIAKQINNLKNGEKIFFRISLESPKCLFCQSDNLSKEHIFPKWIRPYLEETTFEGTEFTNIGNEPLKKVMDSSTTYGKKESSHGFTTNLVCVSCNNTWMSKLENDVKSILTDGNTLVDCIPNNISQENATILSTWLIVKALLLSNKTHSNIHLIQKEVFENIKNGRINSGFLVESSHADKSKFDFSIGKGLLHDNMIKLKKLSLEKGKEMTINFFTCSIQLNHLLFRISYLKSDLPFDRVTSLKHTLKLFPYNSTIRHIKTPDDSKIWKDVANNGLELYLFGMGLLLIEKE